MILSYNNIHFEGPITAVKRVLPNVGSRPTICLDLDGQLVLYFDDPAQIPQLIAQLAELHVMATSPTAERIDEIEAA